MPGLAPVGPAEASGIGSGVDDQVGAGGGRQHACPRAQVPGVGTPARRRDSVRTWWPRSCEYRNEPAARGFPTPPVTRTVPIDGSVAPIPCGHPGTSHRRDLRAVPALLRRPVARNSEGQEVAAVRGVLSSVLGLLGDGATHVGVATDHVIESFRNDMWPGYKTGAGVDPQLLGQFGLAGGGPARHGRRGVAHGDAGGRRRPGVGRGGGRRRPGRGAGRDLHARQGPRANAWSAPGWSRWTGARGS